MVPDAEDRPQLDLTRFSTRDEALELAAAGCPTEYTGVAQEILGRDVALILARCCTCR
jgi:hypothetical protein